MFSIQYCSLECRIHKHLISGTLIAGQSDEATLAVQQAQLLQLLHLAQEACHMLLLKVSVPVHPQHQHLKASPRGRSWLTEVEKSSIVELPGAVSSKGTQVRKPTDSIGY